jgi:pyruvate dehydrogenase (quinone)
VLEARTDPEVPPLPPHITLQQAKAFASTLWTGDPREGSVLAQTAKELVADLLPGRR